MNYSTICSTHHIRALLLMCVVLLSTSVPAQNKETKLTLTIRNATLESFVRQLENATGFSFVYGEEIKVYRRITLEAKGLTIAEILDRAFANEPVGYEISGKHILLHKRPMPERVKRRRFTISGYLTDKASAETLIGANIVEESLATGTTTNPYGFYSLTLPEGEVNLCFSYLGYEPGYHCFVLEGDTLLNIALESNNCLDEVVVLSNKRDAGIQSTALGAHEIPMAQIQHTPAVLGEADMLKTIQLMPGVQAGVEGFSGLYVRGGGADQNLVLLDGIPVYNADHLLGIFSIFTPEAVKNVTLYKSSFPARYGGRLSSIVDVRTNDGDLKNYHGSISAGTLTSKIHLEGPIWKDHTSFSVSARGTHTSLLMPLFKSEGDQYRYYFYDLNAKLSHKFNDRSRVFLNVYNGQDRFRWTYKDDYSYGSSEDNTAYASHSRNATSLLWGNTLVTGRWNYVFNNRLFSNTTVAYNSYRMRIDNTSKEQEVHDAYTNSSSFDYKYRSGIRDWSFRSDFDYTPNPAHDIKFGVEYLYHTFRPESSSTRIKEQNNDERQQDTLYMAPSNSHLYGHELSLYAEDDLSLSSHLSMNLGVHLSLFHTQGKSYFSAQPRVSVRYAFYNGLALKGGFSQMEQYVHLLTSTPLSMPTDLWVPITRRIRPMRSNQYSAGIYYTGLSGWEFSLEGYYKQLYNVLEYQDGVTVFGNSVNWEDKVEMGKGSSKGLEFMAQKTLGRTTGWLSYTLAKSDRQFENGTINNGKPFPYKYDRRHSINLCLNHQFNERIDIGASWIFNTGGTATIAERRTVVIRPDGSLSEENYISGRNNYRLPASHRLNLGVNFNKKTKHGMRTWNISIYNMYNAMNPTLIYTGRENHYYPAQPDGSSYNFEERTVLKKLTILPILPSVTYTYKF